MRSRKRLFPKRGRLKRRRRLQFSEDDLEALRLAAYPEGPPPELPQLREGGLLALPG